MKTKGEGMKLYQVKYINEYDEEKVCTVSADSVECAIEVFVRENEPEYVKELLEVGYFCNIHHSQN